MTSTGSGQKLCKLLKRTFPASNIFWIPGISEIRMPWPSSIRLNPSLLWISHSITSPEVWRPEFQQVENEIISLTSHHATDVSSGSGAGETGRSKHDDQQDSKPRMRRLHKSTTRS